ncbi:MAG: hypothetical protein QS721_06630 [Candidatus Endonucleobacter sp. (ex Gigantidas childressi)]|nr:hypothetical protein [Candidatus Endonucleobacter sp. (ex Gigantidas childressi)]
MTYLHVVIKRSEDVKPLFLFGDLTEKDLKRRFLRQYQLGKSVLKENQVVNLGNVVVVEIIRTSDPLKEALKNLQKKSNDRIDQMNRESSGFMIISVGSGWVNEDIVHCGEDVTLKYVSAPPGGGTPITKIIAFIHSPWVLSLGGGIALIVIGILVKKCFGN